MVKPLSDLILYRNTTFLVLSAISEDLRRAHGGVYALNPPNVVALVRAFGYYTFTLREQDLDYSVSGSVGSILALGEYANTPLPVPESVLVQTRAEVFDLTASVPLGGFHCALAEGLLPVTHLLPGRSYRLTFSAPGYEPVERVESLPGADPCELAVTLNRRVPQSASSRGEVKARFR